VRNRIISVACRDAVRPCHLRSAAQSIVPYGELPGAGIGQCAQPVQCVIGIGVGAAVGRRRAHRGEVVVSVIRVGFGVAVAQRVGHGKGLTKAVVCVGGGYGRAGVQMGRGGAEILICVIGKVG